MDWKNLFSRKSRSRDRERNRPEPTASEKARLTVWQAIGFVLLVVLVASVCFLGKETRGPRVTIGQPAPESIITDLAFEYPSAVLAQRRIAEIRLQEPPVFRRSTEHLNRFKGFLRELDNRFAQDDIELELEGNVRHRRESLGRAVSELVEQTNFPIEAEYILLLEANTTPRERSELLKRTLERLREIHAIGIYSDSPGDRRTDFRVIQIQGENTGNANDPQPDALSTREALIRLRVAINATAFNEATARALFGIFRVAIEPNLLYSQSATEAAIARATARVESPIVRIRAGEAILERGTIVSELDQERFNAYRAESSRLQSQSLVFNETFLERFFLTLVLLLAIALYLKMGVPPHPKRSRAVGIAIIAILFNLALMRFLHEASQSNLLGTSFGSIFPYLAPVALGPILVAVLIGPGPAVMCAFVISLLYGIMQDDSLGLVLGAFLSGLIAALLSGNVCQRSRLVRSSLFGGVVFALTALALGLIAGLNVGVLSQQMLVAVLTGLATGIIAIGMLPFLEKIFNVTTEITLLELTDFNHPLLRRMQLEAPGSYHHSLMVSNLAENAAAAIGASPLLCRACSLFHDIGKLVKPEYFIENQRGGHNPHIGRSPSMSALIIKAHVKEGVDLARRHKLPAVITDVIRQHHGKSLIQYFYIEAKKRLEAERKANEEKGDGSTTDLREIDENTYRYDGPKPRFKESAIIFFADSVEAASRSLKKATTVNIEELVAAIIQDKIDDNQLDECPLTFQELQKIRASFVFTLLNMHHSRIEYPKEERRGKNDPPAQGNAESGTPPIAPTPGQSPAPITARVPRPATLTHQPHSGNGSSPSLPRQQPV